jgi:hypothetical protein
LKQATCGGTKMSTSQPDTHDVLAADARAAGIALLVDDYEMKLSAADVSEIRSLKGAVVDAGWSAPTTQAARLAELLDSPATMRLYQVAEAEREAVMARMTAAAEANPGAVIVDRGSSTVAPTATRTLRRIEKTHQSFRPVSPMSTRVHGRRPARQARSTRATTISRGGSSRRTTSGRSPDDPSSPGDPDPPPRLRRLDGGAEQSRDSKLNRGWQVNLELDLSPLELETLGEYCRIRSEWEGRWAA